MLQASLECSVLAKSFTLSGKGKKYHCCKRKILINYATSNVVMEKLSHFFFTFPK